MLGKTVVATILTAVATGVLAWWAKGDLEMAWLLFMLILPVAGAAIGLVAAFVARAPVLPFATALGPAAGALALMAAMGTPHVWDSHDRARVERQATSLVADPAHVDAVRQARWRITEAALRRRFDAHTLRLARNEGSSAWVEGALLPLRLDHGERDWTLVVLRIGGPDGLEVVRTISRDESRDALARAAARAGREVRDVVIYFTPNQGGVFFEYNVWFDFIGIPADGGANLRLAARFRDGEYSYHTMRWF